VLNCVSLHENVWGEWRHLQVFLNSVLVRGEFSASRPSHFIPDKNLRYPLDRRLSGPSVGLDVVAMGRGGVKVCVCIYI
jgi:hypothetical protein